jgi:23S rRNA pseudouridine955/2504/2580 synthase
MITRTIDRNFANMRLDRFLRKAFPEESLSVFFAILRKKKVRVNGVVGKANQMLQEGDTVCIYENLKSVSNAESAPTSSSWGKNSAPAGKESGWKKQELDIVLETEDYLVVNKPSGMPSQPGSGTRPGESLVENLWQWGRQQRLDFKPTLAHRLDQETSGLLLVALHGDTLRDLTRLIREHEVKKFYLALVKGNLEKDKGTIESSLVRTDNAKGSKMQIDEKGKKSITHYSVKSHYKGYDLVKINLETGRMHQIRAHFASIGHPLLGDTRYGDFALNREFKKQYGLNRLFLHSSRLEYPWQGKNTVQECPLPKELQDVLNKLRG